MNIPRFFKNSSGFTLVELLVGIAILGILTLLALPSLGSFTAGLRADGEISELHRLVLGTRNAAINSGNSAIMCPLVSSQCADNWEQDITIFEDIDGDGNFSDGDNIVKVKSAIAEPDTLTFNGGALLLYSPRGTLQNSTTEAVFIYCPRGYAEKNRGIIISPIGRPYLTQDSNNDGKDDRSGNNVEC